MKAAEWLPGQPVSPRWQIRAAKTLFAIQLGKMLQNDSESDVDLLVPYLKAGHVQWDGVVTDDPPQMWANPRELSKYEVRDGDLLVCEGGEVGRAATLSGAPTTCIIQNSLHRVRPKGTANSRFFKYALEHLAHAGWFEVLCNKATIAHLTGDKLGAIRLPAPPAADQARVVAFLDSKTAAVDKLIKKKERLIELLQEKRLALITQAVTKGLDPDVPMKESGSMWVGNIPRHWEVRPLGHALSFISYGFTNPMPTTDEGPYMLTANDIGEGVVLYESARKTSPDEVRKLSRKCRPVAGDVLVTKDGTLGRVAVADGRPACINQSVAVLTPKSEAISTDFLVLALRAAAYQDKMQFDAGGTTIKHIYITRLVKMLMAFPPLPEQQDICRHLHYEIGSHDRLLNSLGTSVAHLIEYRQALISAAVTGQLDLSKEAA